MEKPDVKDAINEFFKLKHQFEVETNKNKKKIINNKELSKKEKRAEYLKLMPKCINCKKPSKTGTDFTISYHPASDEKESFRVFKAVCGNTMNPCNLHIEIHIGKTDRVDDEMNNIQKEINDFKNEIINDKNKLLFGLLSAESIVELFDENQNYITQLTSIYEGYLNKWNEIVDNREKTIELEETLTKSYGLIDEIKLCIKKMNEHDNNQYAKDAVHIYQNKLIPLLERINNLKYRESDVMYHENNKTCYLMQKKYKIEDIEISGFKNIVVAYEFGLKKRQPTQQTKPLLIIESDTSSNSNSNSNSETLTDSNDIQMNGGEKEFIINIPALA